MINFFFHKKKLDIPKWSFSGFETEPETPFGNRNFFFLKIQLTRIVFWGEIYRELPCRWNHYIIIPGSRSKVGKTMKKSVFSTFVCDPEIMLKWLQHHGNLQWIPPQKTLSSTFFFHKKKLDIPKWSFSDFKTEPETPFGNRNFFFLKIQLTRIVFWGEIYRELPCRSNHYIIISGSRWKVKKTMKNSVFSNFDCDPEIMLKWLQHYGNLR